MKLILASKSPRRRELLGMLCSNFRVEVQQADETIAPGTPPQEAVEQLARRKAQAVKAGPDEAVIGADTIVVLDGHIMGKPADVEDARRMLGALQGRSHSVFTGVCVRDGQKEVTRVCETQVQFAPMTQQEIDWYVSTQEPMDKAGAYGIQGFGGIFVQEIRGDYYNVVGLPISCLYEILRQEWGWNLT